MIEIKEVDELWFEKAKALVFGVFKYMDFPERMSFWIYKNQGNACVKMLMKLCGYTSAMKYWVAVDENEDVCGITGLYGNKSDKDEALWLSWFCVNPKHRGRGIGKQLIEFSIEEAKKHRKKYLRLYTSDDANEADAQFLYEQYGFKIFKREEKAGYTLIYREKELA